MFGEVDLDREAVAGIGDPIQTGVHRSEAHQAGIRDGLTKVVVEDGERAVFGLSRPEVSDSLCKRFVGSEAQDGRYGEVGRPEAAGAGGGRSAS